MANFRRISRGPQLQAKLTKLRTGIQDEVQAGLWKAGDIIIEEQERLAPKGVSKELVRSLERKLVRGEQSGNQAVRVSAGAFYAAFVEFGTQPHEIKPGEAEALQLGPETFAEGVKHPGVAAQPFFFPGYRAARKRARSAIAKGVRQSIIKAVK